MTRKNKSISFDLTDGFEKKLLEYVEMDDKGKFSKYIKRLIANDMQGRPMHPVSVMHVEPEDEDDSTEGYL